jgi:hypothetical protein
MMLGIVSVLGKDVKLISMRKREHNRYLSIEQSTQKISIEQTVTNISKPDITSRKAHKYNTWFHTQREDYKHVSLGLPGNRYPQDRKYNISISQAGENIYKTDNKLYS